MLGHVSPYQLFMVALLPSFFPSAVASYIAYGARKLEATVDDVPDEGIREG